MTRKEKIKLLQDIQSGIKKISNLLDPIWLMWIQVDHSNLFHCEDHNLTKEIGEFPKMLNGRKCHHITVHRGTSPLEIAENEY